MNVRIFKGLKLVTLEIDFRCECDTTNNLWRMIYFKNVVRNCLKRTTQKMPIKFGFITV